MKHTIREAEAYIRACAPQTDPAFRPAFHLTPPVGWINDPNGFCFFRGQYHLFCQYHPYAAKWGPMHWAHFTSTDLLKWEWAGVALAPDTEYDCEGVFSGTALAGSDELVVMYTGVSLTPEGEPRQQQCIARSRDGYTFEKHPLNPVIRTADLPDGFFPQDFRDPKLFRHGDCYCALTAARDAGGGKLLIWHSADLGAWTLAGTFADGLGTMPECPDFQTADGQPLLIASIVRMLENGEKYQDPEPCVYFTGKTDPDMRRFFPDQPRAIDHGPNFYAAQACASPDGTVLIGWMPGWDVRIPTEYLGHGWAGILSLPRMLHMRNGRLIQSPPPALTNRRGPESAVDCTVTPETPLTGMHRSRHEWQLALETASEAELRLFCENALPGAPDPANGIFLRWDARTGMLDFGRGRTGYAMQMENGLPDGGRIQLPENTGALRLHIIADRCTAEVFVQDGSETITLCVFPAGEEWTWSVTSPGSCRVCGSTRELE